MRQNRTVFYVILLGYVCNTGLDVLDLKEK